MSVYLPKLFASKLAHTYSIVARDPDSGEMGVAVQSHWFSVGSIVSWAEAGVGAVATQSFINASFGPRGLALLKQGKNAQKVVTELITSDQGRDVRQLAIVDAQGNVAVHTGDKCIPDAGHHVGDGYSVQANMMLNDRVWPAMAQAFESSQGEPLPERLVAVLEAAQAAGGDVRGKQSAALLVVKGQSSDEVWLDRLVDMRVEDHAEPVKEIKRLLQLFRAYEYMNVGDEAMETNDVDGALRAYSVAGALCPDNLEMKYWHAVSLANVGKTQQALRLFGQVFAQDDNWRLLTQRIFLLEMLNVDQAHYESILSQ